MQTITMSATKARNQFFDILTWVSMGNRAIIKKDNVELAVLSSRNTKTDWIGLRKVMDKAKGSFKGFDINDSPLRGKKAKAWLKRVSGYKF